MGRAGVNLPPPPPNMLDIVTLVQAYDELRTEEPMQTNNDKLFPKLSFG